MKRILEFFEPKKILKSTNFGWLFVLISCVILSKGGVEKIIGTQMMVDSFTAMRLSEFRVGFGILEVISAVLLFIPRTSLLGVILITTLMLSTLVIYIIYSGGVGFYSPLLMISVTLIGYYLRKYGFFNL